MKQVILFLILITALPQVHAQSRRPVIDMHLHAHAADENGPPPLAICVPFVTQFPPYDGSRPWAEVWIDTLRNPPCEEPVWSPNTDAALMQDTIEILKRRNIFGVLGDSPERVRQWRDSAPDRFIPSVGIYDDGEFIDPNEIRKLFESGEFAVMGEVSPQYQGIEPNDERLQIYWALAEELDIPVAFHMAEGIPGANAIWPNHRARLTNPFLLEEVLIRYPNLRISIMHYGSPMIDEMIAILAVFPQVYVDIGGMQWFYPRDYFYGQLKQFIDAGFGKKVMFGSDQMNWPGLIDHSITIIEEAPFLSEQQKRDIFYNNAARFLRLSDEEIAAHHKQ